MTYGPTKKPIKVRAKEAKNGLELKPELKYMIQSGPASTRILAAICYKGGHAAGKYAAMTDVSLGDTVHIMEVLKAEGYIEEAPSALLAPHWIATPKGKAKLLYSVPELGPAAIPEIV